MIAQAIVDGFLSGAVVALGAIGVTFSLAILRFANFSHGDLLSVGGYAALFVLLITGSTLPGATGALSTPIGPFSFGWGLPLAVVFGPACASATGTTTSWLAPLITSLPATSSLPGPVALTLLLWNVACGNSLVLNQSGLTSSASVSAEPSVALPMSMLNAIFAASGFFGSNATCASNFLNLPSTGTPICLLVNAISLWAATIFCCAQAGAAIPAHKASAETAK